MKIAHLTTADISLWYLLRPQLIAVVRRGAIAIGISAHGEYAPNLQEEGVVHVALRHSTRGRSMLADVRAAAELWSVIRRLRPDVLHTHNPKPGVYGRINGRLAGVPVVINTVHGLYASPDDSLFKKSIVYTLESIASRFSDYELVQNIEDYELLTRWHITRPSRTILLGNGIDVHRFDPARFGDPARMAVRDELTIPAGHVVLGIVGRLVRGKGFIELTEAVECLDDRHTVIAIGPDDTDKSDALTVEDKRRAERAGIRFLGGRDDVDRLYAAMDIFVLPSHREGFPRAAMEAAAMGLPIVATNIRGCRQVVDDGVTGILVPLRDSATLADAIRILSHDPSLRESMGLAARRKALREFDQQHVVDTVLRTQVTALREKGHFDHFIDEAAIGLSVRWAESDDLRSLVAIRRSTGGRPRGPSPLRLFRRSRDERRLRRRLDDTVVVEDEFGPVGFGLLSHQHQSREALVSVSIAPPFDRIDLDRRLTKWVRERKPEAADQESRRTAG